MPLPISSGLADESAPVVKLVNSVLADAVRKGASDIHIEPYERMVRVRYRIDGTLYEVMSPPFKLKAAITSRIKIMAELDIAERRIPQDGRIKIKILDRTIDLRVSTLPTIFGEKVVMRILDKGNLRIDLTQFGMGERAFKDLVRAIEAPYGMVLVTGPTGSGKTTTLYSALSRVSVPGVNIMTAEDPVEYNIEGINQVQINDEIGLTFAAALRAFLRQDPNIVMVGEIRDLDTASIATKAALTGHLVLSTLHTNDAPSTVNRLVDMGVEPFLVASSTNLIMAQRLVRRLCATCKVESPLHEEVARELEVTGEPITKIYEPRGCLECAQTGYRGPAGPLRGDADLARHPRADPRPRAGGGDQEAGEHRGHAHPPHGRHSEDPARGHEPGRSVEGDRRRSTRGLAEGLRGLRRAGWPRRPPDRPVAGPALRPALARRALRAPERARPSIPEPAPHRAVPRPGSLRAPTPRP